MTTYTVTSFDDSGAGSLRAAIEAANAAGSGTINFALGSGPVTLRPTGPLPVIAFTGLIDGRSQPGYAGKPMVEIDGSAVPAPPPEVIASPFFVTQGGVQIAASGFTLAGLAVTSFATTGIYVGNAHDIAIVGCYAGIGPNGAAAANLLCGVGVTNSADVRLDGVVVSGNASHGILGYETRAIVLSNAFVGTNADGSAARPNGASGLKVWDCAEIAIGGSVISGNALYGMELAGSGTGGAVVTGCMVGTNAGGAAAIPNGRSGVLVYAAASVRVGGMALGERNILSGNARAGINLDGSAAGEFGGKGLTHDNLIIGNYIGTDITGEVALPNLLRGVLVNYSQAALIDGNLISGNLEDGILVLGPPSPQTEPLMVPSSNRIVRNKIGVSASGAALGNQRHGVYIEKGSWNVVGTSQPGYANTIARNAKRGVYIRGEGWDTNTLGVNTITDNGQANFIAA